MSVEVGKLYRTPWEPSGVVEVLEIENPQYPYDEPTAFVRFVGDHPRGYKDGSPGRYCVKQLEGREVTPPPVREEPKK
jgi:hypothetical protein